MGGIGTRCLDLEHSAYTALRTPRQRVASFTLDLDVTSNAVPVACLRNVPAGARWPLARLLAPEVRSGACVGLGLPQLLVRAEGRGGAVGSVPARRERSRIPHPAPPDLEVDGEAVGVTLGGAEHPSRMAPAAPTASRRRRAEPVSDVRLPMVAWCARRRAGHQRRFRPFRRGGPVAEATQGRGLGGIFTCQAAYAVSYGC
jgi:hypothetical protein